MSIVTDAGLLRLLTLLNNDITHVAVGTGNLPGYYDSVVGDEISRKPSINAINGFGLSVETKFTENEANGVITNVGCLCNGAADLFASFIENINKTNTQSLSLKFDILIQTDYNICSEQTLSSEFIVL